MTTTLAAVELLPCPFCGGSVDLEQPQRVIARGSFDNPDEWWGVVCRNGGNLGGSCAIQQRASRTKAAAITRWNTRITHQTDRAAVAEQPTVDVGVFATDNSDYFRLTGCDKADQRRFDVRISKGAAETLMHEISGLLVTPHDREAAIARAARLAKHVALLERMNASLREDNAHFQTDRAAVKALIDAAKKWAEDPDPSAEQLILDALANLERTI